MLTNIQQSMLPDDTRHTKAISSRDESVISLMNRFLKVGIVEFRPFTIIHELHGSWIYSGLEVTFVRTIAERLNITVQFYQPPGGEKWGKLAEDNCTGLMRMIQSHEVDFGIGSVDRSLLRNTILQAGVALVNDVVVFAVPSGSMVPSLKRLMRPFSTRAWIVIVLVAFLMSLIMGLHVIVLPNRVKLNRIKGPALDVWQLLLGGVLSSTPKSNFRRLIVTGWIFATMILRTCYQAVYFQHLRSGADFKPLLSLEDIDDAGLHYYMYDILRRLFGCCPHILEMSRTIPESTNGHEVLAQIADNKLKAVVPLPYLYISYYSNHRQGKDPVYMSKYVIQSYGVGIYYPKNSTLPSIFNATILQIHAAGLSQLWSKQYGDFNYFHDVQHKALGIQALFGAFKIYLLLCGCSIIVFAMEKFFSCR
ncbi:uncharacterized protein LOC129728898 [Wyeomyia smithii]|uniref:uncharacterized protein LOC129728898 n=1 Tax=Wyeomyia smithii TaxID=174621 RepID=UPI002467B346|nr:uncharacterized protein LOC129728898 [Wyeomyia smithii]